MLIREVQADHYRIPLPVALSDSTHGTIRAFELITVRVRDADGAEDAEAADGLALGLGLGDCVACVHAETRNRQTRNVVAATR